MAVLDPERSFPSKAMEAIHLRQLEYYRRGFEAGSILALYEALDYCLSKNIRVESWMARGAMSAIELMSPFDKRGKRGRATHPIARNRQDLIHLNRYYAVIEARGYQERAARELKEMRKEGGSAKELQTAARLSREAGTTWLEVYETAARELRGTASFGSPDAIKRSYLLVRPNIDHETRALRYFQVSSRTLARLGIRSL